MVLGVHAGILQSCRSAVMPDRALNRAFEQR